MFNGCQILISTPRFLVRFMDRNRKLLNYESLQYLILDDGDIILDKYFNSVSLIAFVIHFFSFIHKKHESVLFHR